MQTFVNALKSSIDIPSINNFFLSDRDLTLEILQKVRPEGRVDGDRFKLASASGGAGGSFDFNLSNHYWGDWATNQQSAGIMGFLQETLKYNTIQVIDFLKTQGYLKSTDISKIITSNDGNPLEFPIPEELSSWEALLEERVLRKDRGLITNHWKYLDTDGNLLGYKFRVDDRRTTKEVYTLTYRSQTGWTKKAWKKGVVPPYGLHKLSEGPVIRVLFVEGEKAADKAQEILGDKWKVLSFSGVGASDKLWLPDGDFWAGAEVVIWPDNDRAGREAARKIQLKLQELRNLPRSIKTVRVDKIPGLPQKWDLGDFDNSGVVDVEYELSNAEEAGSFDEVCREWVFVSQNDAFYNLDDRTLIWSPASFDRTYSRFAERAMPPSKKFLVDSTTVKADALDFVPGHGEIIKSPNGKFFLNEWYPTEPYREGMRIADDPEVSDEEIAENAKFFIEHLERICNSEVVEPDRDQETGEIVEGTEGRTLVDALTWHFSEIVKSPMDKRGWIPMLVSENNGTGKSYFNDVMSGIHGDNRAKRISVGQFLGDYHDWKDGTLFYELAETKSHDSTEVYEELKKLHSYKPFNSRNLTDRTKGAQHLNIKSKAQKVQRDFLNGCITSNHLYPISLANSAGSETGDRRLLVIRCEEILSEKQASDLFDDELADRPEWIAAYLIRFKPRFKWNPSWAPVTAHKRDMLEADRERSEARLEKDDVGRFSEFYQFFNFALEHKMGALGRKVFTADQIRGVMDAAKVKFPYNRKKLEAMLARHDIHRCENKVEIVEGVDEYAYTVDPSYIKASRSDLTKAATASLGF